MGSKLIIEDKCQLCLQRHFLDLLFNLDPSVSCLCEMRNSDVEEFYTAAIAQFVKGKSNLDPSTA